MHISCDTTITNVNLKTINFYAPDNIESLNLLGILTYWYLCITFQKTKIFVGRLPDEAQAQDLRHLFEQYGIVTECDILNRYGFVHMKTEEMAVRAIKELNNAEFMGVQISVEVIEISSYYFVLGNLLTLKVCGYALHLSLTGYWIKFVFNCEYIKFCYLYNCVVVL